MLRAVPAALILANAAAVTLSATRQAHAQGSPRVDSSAASRAIAAGRLELAEALLYNASLRSTHDPAARGALGKFLAARGQFLVGATLLDEALQFGADTVTINTRLFDVYRWNGQYGRAAALRGVRLSAPEREAMRRAGVAATRGAATATVPLRPAGASALGSITISVGTVQVVAEIEAQEDGLRLPSTPALSAALQTVGSRGDTTFAVAATVAIGSVTLGPVPVRIDPTLSAARIGLDVLALLCPTFDAATLTVHSGGPASVGTKLPLMLTFPGVSFFPVEGSPAVALQAADGRAALRGYRWTLDVRAGAIVIEK